MKNEIESMISELEKMVKNFEIPKGIVITQPEMPYRGMIVAIKKRIEDIDEILDKIEFVCKILEEFDTKEDFIKWHKDIKEKFESIVREFNKKLFELP